MRLLLITIALSATSTVSAVDPNPVAARKPDDPKAISALKSAGIWVTVIRVRTAQRVVLPAMDRFSDADLEPLKKLHHVEVL